MQVIEYIRQHGLAQLESEFGIKATRHKTYPNLVLLKYDQIESPSAHPIVVECRGVILDETDDWKIISRPFDRFFNHGDVNAAAIDWSTAKVYEKLDGSLLTLYWYDRESQWLVASSGTPDASGPVGTLTSETFADLFWRVWKEKGYQIPGPHMCEPITCYMFELMTPLNRIVVQHSENRLVLLGVRDVENAPNYECPVEVHAKAWGWECVKSFPLTSFEDAIKACEGLSPIAQEGFVVCDGDYRRVKVKSPQYVALHHLKDGFSARRMIEIVRTNESDEFLAYFPEFADLHARTREAYEALVAELEAMYARIKDIAVQKEFALEAVKTRLSGCLFALRSGKSPSVREHLKKMQVTALEDILRVKGIEVAAASPAIG